MVSVEFCQSKFIHCYWLQGELCVEMLLQKYTFCKQLMSGGLQYFVLTNNSYWIITREERLAVVHTQSANQMLRSAKTFHSV